MAAAPHPAPRGLIVASGRPASNVEPNGRRGTVPLLLGTTSSATLLATQPADLLVALCRVQIRWPRSHVALAALAIAVVAVALVVRWNHITALPFDFHAARQYHSAQLARSYYVLNFDSSPAWQKRVASTRLKEDPPLELPVFPFGTATAYQLSGGERLWIPRLFSSFSWITGAFLLYLLALRFAPRWGALFAVGLFLFFPFPLVASTSFQPDPLMVMLILAALLAIVRHHEHPTTQRFIGALVLSGAAVLVKPGIAAFFLFPVFAALAIVRVGIQRTLTSARFYALPALSFLPVAGLYLYSAITGQFVSGRISESVNPPLLLDSFFWSGWRDSIVAVLRPPFFGERSALMVLAASLCGIVLARTRMQRAVLIGLSSGYVVFALTINNYVSTHDYYSLPLVPIAALSLAVVAAVVVDHLRGPLSRRPVQVAAGALLVAISAIALSEAQKPSLFRPNPEYERRVEVYEEIGELVNHTSRALVLGGTGLWHHAWIAGKYWPERGDLLWEQDLAGLAPMSADERFVTTDSRYYPSVGAMRPHPTVFIVAEPIELTLQPDLSVLLSDFAVLADAPDYLIFDLTRKLATTQPGTTRDDVGAPPLTSDTESFYQFPPTWSRVVRGMSKDEVQHILGRPRRTDVRRDFRKPFESWFYGPDDRYAIVFVEGDVFATAHSRK